MLRSIAFFSVLLFFFNQSALAASQNLFYQDAHNIRWQRAILEEDHGGGRTLLLVVDSPKISNAGNAPLERVVFRKSFAASERELFLTAREYYSQLPPETLQSVANLAEDSRVPRLHNPLWVATKNQWTLEDEAAYTAWFTANVTTDYLVGSGVSVDCADFAITVRWTYAHDHKLPAANTLSGGELFGQWSGSSDWDQLPTDPNWRKDKRFLAALRYLLNATYTHSIILDLYPVELTRNFVSPGSVLLVLYSQTTGHTQLINTYDQGHYCSGPCLTVIYGNEPAAETAYINTAWMENRGAAGGGFLRWRWPLLGNNGWTLTDSKNMPGYSLEQYSQPGLDDSDFQAWVYQKLGIGSSASSPVYQSFGF